jgi:PIN domain nuclease of toxin-antitoxin system
VRHLLDTHIWIWSLIDPDRLSAEVHDALSEPDHEIWLSAISVWETLVLIRKGRLELKNVEGQAWVADALAKSPVREAPITYKVAMASERLALNHWDPADRFIAATAQVLEATLITADARLIACTDVTVLANR